MKGKINHIKILFCAILLLFVTSLLLTQNRVMAEDENPNLNLITNLRSAKEVVDKAAKYHLLGTAMWECQSWVRGQKTEGEENNTGVFQERKDNGHFFYYTLDDIEYFWFGPFLEEAATGEFQDGAFACKEGIAYEDWPDSGGILDYFARQTQDDETYKDEGIQAVICNQWRRRVAGWLQSITTINDPYRGLDCIDVFDDRGKNGKDLVFYTYDEDNQTLNFHPGNIDGEDTPQESIDWINNLEGIHHYKSGNGYMEDYWQYFRLHDQVKADEYDSNLQPANELIPIWGDQLDLDRLNGKNDKSQLNKAKRHYIYRKDFDTACAPKATAISGDNYRDGDPLEGDNIMWLKAMNYNKEDSIKGTQRLEGFTTNGWYTGIPPLKVLTDDKLNCWDLAERVNETYEAYNKEIAKIAEDDCNKNDEINKVWNFVKAKSDIIVKQYKDPKSVTPVAIGINGEQYDPAKLTPEQIEGAQKRNMFWVNYEEVEDENGKVSYNLLTFTAEELNKAQTDLTAYNLYGNNHHFHLIDGNDLTKGFSCEVPEGYDVGTIGHTYSDSDDPEAGDSDPCYDAGVEGMSWVLCPTINNSAHTIDDFEKALKKMLSIESNKLFGTDKESYRIWETFRNLANVILTIIFLAIIFSQLTGYGIDNYGIKKMLPKLIIMAILINLSYVLCEIAVDLSNILGVGLNNLFESMAGSAASQNTTYQIVFALLAAAAGLTAGVTIVFSLMGQGGGGAVVVALVFALLSALVIAFMFVVMVGLRMIIVVICAVVSPVALVLYILPNTQSLFKKWWKIFLAALVVYPICGALYGVHFIIKGILLEQRNDGGINFFMGVAAVIAPFLPFIALPSLLKGALAGLGAVAGAVTAFGSGLKKGANKTGSAIKNTKAYKGMQERGAERSAERRATRIRDRLQNAADKRGGINKLNASQQRRLFQAQTTLNEQNQRRAQAAVGASDNSKVALSRAEAARDATEYKAFQDQFASPNFNLTDEAANAATWYNPDDRISQQRMRALIGAMESRGMENDIFGMLKSNPNIGGDSVAMNALAGSNNKVLKAYGKRGAGQSFNDFMNGTGENSLKGYAKSKGKDFISGIDDKALAEIADTNPDAISTDQLAAAAASVNDADSLAAVNKMIGSRRDISISGKQLASYDESTIRALSGNSIAIEAILQASDDIANNQELINTLNPGARKAINELRGKGYGGRTRNMI